MFRILSQIQLKRPGSESLKIAKAGALRGWLTLEPFTELN